MEPITYIPGHMLDTVSPLMYITVESIIIAIVERVIEASDSVLCWDNIIITHYSDCMHD